jgi:small subunit ribosomal protein S13
MAEEKKAAKQIVRFLSTDIKGDRAFTKGITRIRGIGHNLARAITIKLKLDNTKKINTYSETELKELEEKIKTMSMVETWQLNRQKDYDSGEDKHLITTAIKLRKDFDQKRLQKIKSYRGLRLQSGHPVRGQRTKAHFRKGKVVGVKKKGKR